MTRVPFIMDLHLPGQSDGSRAPVQARDSALTRPVPPDGAQLAEANDNMDHQIHSPIERFMTPEPLCVDRNELLAVAGERMRAHGFRHLPVLDGGKIVGIVSQSDVLLASAQPSDGPSAGLVEDAMSYTPYVVPPERPVGEVAAKMVESGHGCTLVARAGHVIGIFTTTDALRVLVGIVERGR